MAPEIIPTDPQGKRILKINRLIPPMEIIYKMKYEARTSMPKNPVLKFCKIFFDKDNGF